MSSQRLAALAGRYSLLLSGLSCAGTRNTPSKAPVHEGPEAAILRIASIWEARQGDKGLRSSPSPVASFDRQSVTRLELTEGQPNAIEHLTFTERFILRDGGEVHCSLSLSTDVAIVYGIKAGEPALQMSWPAANRERQCDVPNAPIPSFERPAGRARFVLRSDQLVGVDPPLEKRTFFPVDQVSHDP